MNSYSIALCHHRTKIKLVAKSGRLAGKKNKKEVQKFFLNNTTLKFARFKCTKMWKQKMWTCKMGQKKCKSRKWPDLLAVSHSVCVQRRPGQVIECHWDCGQCEALAVGQFEPHHCVHPPSAASNDTHPLLPRTTTKILLLLQLLQLWLLIRVVP